MASVVVPLAKLFGLAWLLWQTRRGSAQLLQQRTRVYRLIDTIGRWSNIDVFMISILGALVQFGALERVRPEPGALAFAGVVLITMFAAQCFDPRAIVAGRDAQRRRADMSEDPPQHHEEVPPAERTRRRLSVIWLAPAFALAVVAWLSLHTLLQRGPAVTIRFSSAEGLTAGETEIRHKGVRVGTVESFVLSPDLSEVIVHARMTREVSTHSYRQHTLLDRDTTGRHQRYLRSEQRWCRAPISRCTPEKANRSAILSALRIHPLLQPDAPGRAFTLTEDELVPSVRAHRSTIAAYRSDRLRATPWTAAASV